MTSRVEAPKARAACVCGKTTRCTHAKRHKGDYTLATEQELHLGG